MNLRTRLLFLPLALSALLTACLSDKAPAPEAVTPASCDTTSVTYTAVIQPLFEANCTIPTCHNATDYAADGGSGVPLYDYDTVKDQTQNGDVVCAIEHTCSVPMPEDRPKLSDCQILQVKTWLAKGCPQ